MYLKLGVPLLRLLPNFCVSDCSGMQGVRTADPKIGMVFLSGLGPDMLIGPILRSRGVLRGAPGDMW